MQMSQVKVILYIGAWSVVASGISNLVWGEHSKFWGIDFWGTDHKYQKAFKELIEET